MAYEFFFSYTRDDRDRYMEEFLNDLSAEVGRARARAKEDDYVFLDQGEIVLGQDWRPRLLDGLQNSLVLVSAYTPRYFKSTWCGREIAYFQRRQAACAAPPVFPCVIPLLWAVDTDAIPESVSAVTFKDKSLPPEYAEEGMLQLTRLKGSRYADAYWAALNAIAEAVVRAAEQGLAPLANPPQPDRLDEIQSVFHPKPMAAAAAAGMQAGAPAAATPAAVPEPELPPAGPGSVLCFYLAGRRAELQQAKKKAIEYYHPDQGKYWRPSPAGQRLASLVELVAGSRDLDLVTADQPLDGQLMRRLQLARDRNNRVILFADAWSIHLLDAYRNHAICYDEHAYFNSCLLVVWNEADSDLTDDMKASLTRSLSKCLKTASTRQEPFFVPRVIGQSDLETRLRQGLERLMHKIAETGETNMAPEGMARPQLPVHSGNQ